MKIGTMNDKGGVGKSAITQQIAMLNNFQIIELDPYGNLSSRFEGVIAYEQGEKVEIPNESCVVDFGGFAHEQEDEIIEALDVLVVPFLPTAESVETTYNMIDRIRECDTPILFVANRVTSRDETAVVSAFKLFSELLEDGANLGYLSESRTVHSAVNNAESIVEVAESKGLRGYSFKKMAEQFKNLNQKIKDTIEGEILDVR